MVAVARHMQNLIWTVRRLAARSRGNRGKVKHVLSGRTDAPAGLTASPVEATASIGRGRRLYIDVTATVHGIGVGGIPRTVTKLLEVSVGHEDIIPVIGDGGRLWRMEGDGKTGRPIAFAPGDVYLLIDQFWYPGTTFAVFCDDARRAGALCVFCIYDIVPLLYPLLFDRTFIMKFSNAFPRAVASFDRIVTISRSSADDIGAYLREHYSELEIEVVAFRLGSDAASAVEGPVRDQVAALFRTPGTFLSVGSVLPHKGHLIAIAAMEEVWRAGHDRTYVIMGKKDRTMDCISAFIEHHPELGRRLHWLQDASDAEIQFAYRNASCLIQPSIAEGFGLPVVEALSHAMPVLASDIPIFREVGGEALTYFDLCDSSMLARRIKENAFRANPVDQAAVISWRESLEELLQVLDFPAEADGPATPAPRLRRTGVEQPRDDRGCYGGTPVERGADGHGRGDVRATRSIWSVPRPWPTRGVPVKSLPGKGRISGSEHQPGSATVFGRADALIAVRAGA